MPDKKSALPALMTEDTLEDSPAVRLAILMTDPVGTNIKCDNFRFAVGRSQKTGAVRYLLASTESEYEYKDGKLILEPNDTHLFIFGPKSKSVVVPRVTAEMFKEIAEQSGIVWTGVASLPLPPPKPASTGGPPTP